MPDVGNELECEGSMSVFCLRFYSKRRPMGWSICTVLKLFRNNMLLINQQVKSRFPKRACIREPWVAITMFMQCSARKCGTEAQQGKKQKNFLQNLVNSGRLTNGRQQRQANDSVVKKATLERQLPLRTQTQVRTAIGK